MSLRTEFCGIDLKHPVINASGTYDAIAAMKVFGDELVEQFPFSAFVTKTVTLKPRVGNPPLRLSEVASGLVNSIGLPNKGVNRFIAEDLPELERLSVPIIVNTMGSNTEEFSALVTQISGCQGVSAIELNVSCPNVKTGLDIGSDPDELGRLVEKVTSITDLPIIVKLTPNTTSVVQTATAAEQGGASAVSLINTLRATVIDRSSGSARLGGVTGGLSGAAIRPVAMAQVMAVASTVSVPVIGMGGVQCAEHVKEMQRLGAKVVAIGTENFRDPAVGSKTVSELQKSL